MQARAGFILVFLLLGGSPAVAQDQNRGVGLRIVPGVGLASASFGDDSPRSTTTGAVTVGGLFLVPLSSKTDVVIEATWRPTKVDNPHFDESFTSVYLMGGVQIGRAGLYFRPSLGVDFQSWSGGMSGSDTGTAPAIGLALGTERPMGAGPWHIAPEGSLRFSLTHGLSSLLLTLSFGVGWRGGN